MRTPKRRTRVSRGHKIVVLLLGHRWNAIVYDRPQGGSIVASDIEGDTAQDAMVAAMRFIGRRLASPAAGPKKRGTAA